MTNKIVMPKVRLLRHTENPRALIATAGRLTYTGKNPDTLEESLTEEEISKTVLAILERKHLSCLRHVTFTFLVSGIGRACSHQMVRHTVGTAYEQRSQHYKIEKDFNVVLPSGLDIDQEAMYMEGVQQSQFIYDSLIEQGVPRDEARQILPNGVETVLMVTMNLEAVYNFVKARACRVNTKEILQVAILIRNIVSKIIPEMAKHLGPPCWLSGMCYEQAKFYSHCKKPWQSPTILVDPEFPKRIEYVGIGGQLHVQDTTKLFKIVKPFTPENYP